MNDPYITQMMPLVRSWVAMPLDQAKAEIKSYMEKAGCHSSLDFELLGCSEDVQEAVGLVFGLNAP